MDADGLNTVAETLVSFASGKTSGRGRIVFLDPASVDQLAVVVDQTPFHPVDHTWPDQPGDLGTLADVLVRATVMGAIDSDGALVIGEQIPVKRGDSDWMWCVVHLVDRDGTHRLDLGQDVELQVDEPRRAALSRAHSACHLAALAMNHATADLWSKSVRLDSLGHPDLDQIAMVSSFIDEGGSTDTYRLGKSLRKKGFQSGALVDGLRMVESDVQQLLQEWIDTDASVSVIDGGDRRITAPRQWSCALPSGTGIAPCGGTHVESLASLTGFSVRYEISAEDSTLTVRTQAPAYASVG